ETDVPLTALTDVSIFVVGEVTIRATAAMDYLFKHDGRCRIRGGRLILDGNGQIAHTVFHSTNLLPDIQYVHTIDGRYGCNAGSAYTVGNSGDAQGDGFYSHCWVEDATVRGFAIHGDASVPLGSKTQVVVFEECRTFGPNCGRDSHIIQVAH